MIYILVANELVNLEKIVNIFKNDGYSHCNTKQYEIVFLGDDGFKIVKTFKEKGNRDDSFQDIVEQFSVPLKPSR